MIPTIGLGLFLAFALCAQPAASAPTEPSTLARSESSAQSPPEPSLNFSALRPTLLTEADYRTYPSEVEGYSGFALARFRPGLLFTPTSWLRAVGSIEFAGEHPLILDAYLRLRAADGVEFTIGYSKPPLFASFIYEPVHVMPFPDRAPVISSFIIRRDLGVDLHFSPREIPLEAWLRVGNGTGSPLGNDNALPAGYASLDWVLGRAWVGSAPEDRSFGLRLGASAFIENVRDRDGILGRTPLGFVYFRPLVVSGQRTITEAHGVGYMGPVRLTIEAAFASESRSRDDDGNPATPRVPLTAVDSCGLTAELAWVLLGEPREVSQAPRAASSPTGAWTGGALEVGLRYDGLWLGRGAEDVTPGGSRGGALSLKWWPAPFLAVTGAASLTRYVNSPIEDPDRLWSWGLLSRVGFFWGQPQLLR